MLGIAGLQAVSLGEEPAEESSSLSVEDRLTKRTLGKLTKAEQNLLKYTNLARKQHDKAPLTAVSHLNVVAQQHAINMAHQQKMAHELDGKSVTDRLAGVDYQFGTYGENVAAGFKTEKATVQSWLKSPPHRENLLDEKDRGFTHIGIGAHKGNNGAWYCCQVFARPAPGKTYE
jgi:uncharacterized protein YkwD